MNTLDLHIHSKYSCDGQYEIGDLAKMAADCGLKTIAMADHNSVAWLVEAMGAGRRLESMSFPVLNRLSL